MRISRHVKTYGKITNDEYSDFLPRANRDFRSCKWFSAKISRVVDGDTIVVNPYDGGGEVVVRLDKIDAPEKGQPFGLTLSLQPWGPAVRLSLRKAGMEGRL